MEITIGDKRLEYLDLANKSWSEEAFPQVQKFIDDFLRTIRDNSQIAEELKTEFDKAEKTKNNTWDKIVKETNEQPTVLQTENRYYGAQNIELENLNNRLNICWQIAIKYKLFSPNAD